MIIGEWISNDDKALSIKFTENYYFELENGRVTDSSTYRLSHSSCEEEKQKIDETIEYLAILDKEGGVSFCYSIGVLNDTDLSLVYLSGNGAISTYYRNK